MTASIELDLEQKFEAFPPEIRKVLKMCICALPLVFVDASIKNDDLSSLSSDESKLSHSPIDYIPVAAVNMLWCELLDWHGEFHDEEYYCKERTEANNEKIEYWRNFITEEDRIAFLQKCKMYGNIRKESSAKSKFHRRNSMDFVKHNAANYLFQRKRPKPINTVQNPVFDFITDSLLSTGFLHTHINDKNDDISKSETYAFKRSEDSKCSPEKDQWFEQNKEFIKWFETNTTVTQTQLINATTVLEYFNLDSEGIADVLNLKKHFPEKELGIEKMFKLCNEALVDACVRRLELKECLISNNFSVDNKIWIQRDVSSVYSIRMLPIHCIRAGDMPRCVSLLRSSSFLSLRLEIIGIKDATRQHRLDCKEMGFRLKKISNIDPKSSIIKSIRTMKNALDTCKNEDNQGLIGKALHGLGSMLDNMDFLDEAMEFYQYAVDYKRRAPEFSPKSLVHTLQRMGDLSTIHGRYSDGLAFYEEAVAFSKNSISSDVIKLLQRIAKVCGFIGNYENAIIAYNQIIKLQNRMKKSHIEICESFNAMGNIFEIAKLSEEAVICYSKVLTIMSKNQEEEHRLIGIMNYNLGRLYYEREDYDSALSNYAKALNWRRKYHGDKHIMVAQVLHTIGRVYFAKSEFKLAASNHQLSLAIHKNDFGLNHFKTKRVMFDLAFAQYEGKEYGKALSIYDEIMHTLKINSDENHVEIAFTLHNMGLCHAGKSDYINAIQCFEKSLNIHNDDSKDMQLTTKHVLSISHTSSDSKENQVCLDIMDILINLGLSYSETGVLSNSIDCFETLIDFLHMENPNGTEVADVYQTLGDVYSKHNLPQRASTCYTNAYRIRKAKSKDFRIYESDYYNSMGVTYLKSDEDELAMVHFKKSLSIRQQCLGDTHEKVADTYVNIGKTYSHFLLYPEALDCYNTAISIYETELGLQHQKIADLFYNIAIIKANMGNYKNSITIFEKALMIYRDLECPDNQSYFSNTVEWIVYLREKVFLKTDYKLSITKKNPVESKLKIVDSISTDRPLRRCHTLCTKKSMENLCEMFRRNQ